MPTFSRGFWVGMVFQIALLALLPMRPGWGDPLVRGGFLVATGLLVEAAYWLARHVRLELR